MLSAALCDELPGEGGCVAPGPGHSAVAEARRGGSARYGRDFNPFNQLEVQEFGFD